jgi:hypothetical protein
VITGGNGNDTSSAGAADTPIGDAGIDGATYSSAVTINLATGINTGEAAGA